jgi:heme-degrading monooxygenase HmoA
MGTMPPRLRQVPGLTFFKIMGSGKGSVFSLQPDFYQYGLLATWASQEAAERFLQASPVMDAYRAHSHELWTVKMLPLRAQGLWDGVNPFAPAIPAVATAAPLAVLTRAAIRLRALPAFWRYGKQTSRDLAAAPGLMAAAGLGELPYVRQATFSIWENEQAMRQYAYGTAHHQQVIRQTRSQGWYKEELFARFQILSASGTWKGRQVLGDSC